MGRPTKAIATKTGAISKEEQKRREENEKKISGGSNEVTKATMKLTKDQKKIRKMLLKELSQVLTNVDRYILDQCVISIDRLQKIEEKINENPEELFDKSVISAKKQCFAEFVRLCSELSMSPQSRAKIANNIKTVETTNPLKELFGDEGEGE